MKIVFLTPAADIRRSLIYLLGNNIYTRPNAITGPLILGGILSRAGHHVEVYEELYTKLNYKKMLDSDIIGIYTMTSNANRAYHLADYFRMNGIRVIIGGIHATVCPEEALEHADTVVAGEAESVIRNVVEEKDLKGIVHAEKIMNLDEIPFPDYSLMRTPCREANVMATRGCNFRCSFCSTSRMFSPYRMRSVENVLEELALYKKLGFQFMNFQDDNFTANRNRTLEILTKMLERGLTFKDTFFFGRADIAQDEELLTLLSRTHFSSLLVGFESLNQNALDEIGKRLEIEKVKDAAAQFARHKIKLIASLVLGLDSDSTEDIRRSVDFALHVNAFTLQPAVLTPLPGTKTYHLLKEKKRLLPVDWQYFDLMHATFKPAKMSAEELQKSFYQALLRFYTFRSAFRMIGIYGIIPAFRRLGLWIVMHIGTLFSHLTDKHFFQQLR